MNLFNSTMQSVAAQTVKPGGGQSAISSPDLAAIGRLISSMDRFRRKTAFLSGCRQCRHVLIKIWFTNSGIGRAGGFFETAR